MDNVSDSVSDVHVDAQLQTQRAQELLWTIYRYAKTAHAPKKKIIQFMTEIYMMGEGVVPPGSWRCQRKVVAHSVTKALAGLKSKDKKSHEQGGTGAATTSPVTPPVMITDLPHYSTYEMLGRIMFSHISKGGQFPLPKLDFQRELKMMDLKGDNVLDALEIELVIPIVSLPEECRKFGFMLLNERFPHRPVPIWESLAQAWEEKAVYRYKDIPIPQPKDHPLSHYLEHFVRRFPSFYVDKPTSSPYHDAFVAAAYIHYNRFVPCGLADIAKMLAEDFSHKTEREWRAHCGYIESLTSEMYPWHELYNEHLWRDFYGLVNRREENGAVKVGQSVDAEGEESTSSVGTLLPSVVTATGDKSVEEVIEIPDDEEGNNSVKVNGEKRSITESPVAKAAESNGSKSETPTSIHVPQETSTAKSSQPKANPAQRYEPVTLPKPRHDISAFFAPYGKNTHLANDPGTPNRPAPKNVYLSGHKGYAGPSPYRSVNHYGQPHNVQQYWHSHAPGQVQQQQQPLTQQGYQQPQMGYQHPQMGYQHPQMAYQHPQYQHQHHPQYQQHQLHHQASGPTQWGMHGHNSSAVNDYLRPSSSNSGLTTGARVPQNAGSKRSHMQEHQPRPHR